MNAKRLFANYRKQIEGRKISAWQSFVGKRALIGKKQIHTFFFLNNTDNRMLSLKFPAVRSFSTIYFCNLNTCKIH